MAFKVFTLSSEVLDTGVIFSRTRPPIEGDLAINFFSAKLRGELGVGVKSPLRFTGDVGDRFEGTVLLLPSPLPLLAVTGLPAVDETILRRLPYFRTSSAAALDVDGDLLITVLERRGDAGDAETTGTLRLSTASVSGFPRIPNKKWS